MTTETPETGAGAGAQEIFLGRGWRFFNALLMPVLIGIGSGAITIVVATARLEERVATLERHVISRSTEINTQRALEQEFERRLSRNEASIDHMAHRLDEIAADIKVLLKEQRHENDLTAARR